MTVRNCWLFYHFAGTIALKHGSYCEVQRTCRDKTCIKDVFTLWYAPHLLLTPSPEMTETKLQHVLYVAFVLIGDGNKVLLIYKSYKLSIVHPFYFTVAKLVQNLNHEGIRQVRVQSFLTHHNIPITCYSLQHFSFKPELKGATHKQVFCQQP